MRIALWVFVLVTSIMLFQCDRIEYEDSDTLDFSVSVDTVYFDTVFTEIGSVTKSFKVYNHHDKFVTLDRIYLEDESSFFKMNVNGQVGNEIKSIDIPPLDSIYVFLIATIDPDKDISSSPFIIEENLVVEAKSSNKKSLKVIAWGQNANYFPDRFHGRKTSVLNCQNGTLLFDDEKPFVIYGRVVIDSCVLEIAEGNRVFFHGGIVPVENGFYQDGQLYITKNSQLHIRGTAESPVVIKGDRLEPEWQYAVGLFRGITIGPESRGNIIEYAQITQANSGLEIDSAASLVINNTEIQSTSGPGIRTRFSQVNMTNCLVVGSGKFNVYFEYGGDYDIQYCTFSNFGAEEFALGAVNYFDPNPGDASIPLRYNPLKLRMTNSILATDHPISIVIGEGDHPELVDYHIDHTMMTLSEENYNVNPELTTLCDSCYYFSPRTEEADNIFIDRGEGDYHLDTMSWAEEKAKFLPDVLIDIEGIDRSAKPDLGAYESRLKDLNRAKPRQ